LAINRRFLGAWELVSFESRSPDGTLTYPMGRDPVGIFICHESGYISAQLGPRTGDGAGYVAYFGLAEADDAPEGTLITRVIGASSRRLHDDQVRQFAFTSGDELMLRPVPVPGGPTMTLLWRRLPPGDDALRRQPA
jgi:hypothetical protein